MDEEKELIMAGIRLVRAVLLSNGFQALIETAEDGGFLIELDK